MKFLYYQKYISTNPNKKIQGILLTYNKAQLQKFNHQKSLHSGLAKYRPNIHKFNPRHRKMTNTSSNPTPIPISDYFESSYSLEGNFSFENLDYYADGTLFPVHIGDLFPPKDEGDESHLYRYKVLLKIGHGSYSTVWLAIDLENETHVALKFLSRGRDTELSLYQSLSEAEGSLGQESVVTLRNSFRVGLRNEHTVLVFDVLIPWTFLTQKQKEQLNLKATVFELASGLSFLHSTNITHGDLHQGNLALKISPEFMFTGDEFIGELNFPDVIPILPIPYSKERVRQPPPNYQPPKYLMSNNVFLDYAKEVLSHEGALSTAKLQIIDLSNGNWLTLLCFLYHFFANILLPNCSIPKHANRNPID
ncbi:hypothetical protein OCU04_004546 [Sclerotinia nivalis]|uniref:non-specific serine/threonine protein kinase n=1 Tax=Sclerotinia nivalis TaxID=352851 RepID=A0A9X0AQP2_9HELO|nr:hypothetical protein OCU04_004546 [Sclerotinia nivalis]